MRAVKSHALGSINRTKNAEERRGRKGGENEKKQRRKRERTKS
jgi:hypothetical protein